MGRKRCLPPVAALENEKQEQEQEQQQEQEQVAMKKKGRKRKIVSEEQQRLLERQKEERAQRREQRKENKRQKEERIGDDDRSETWEYDCTAAFFSNPHWWLPPHLPPAVDFPLLPRLPHHYFPSLSSRQIDYLFCVADDEIEASTDTNDFYYHHAVTYAQQRRQREQEQEQDFEEEQEQVSEQEQVDKDRRHLQHMLQFVIRQRIDKWPNDLRTIDLLFLLLRDLRIPYSIPDMSLISRQPTMAETVPPTDDATGSTGAANERQSASVSR